MRVVSSAERVGVPGHRLAALRVELGDAVRLDVLLAGEAQLLLDRQLDRQAVAVPAGLAGHVVALHGLEAREDVLEDAGLDVVGAGHAVGGRRALVEDPLGPALGLLQRNGRRSCARSRSRAPRARARAGRPGRAPGGTAAARSGSSGLPPADTVAVAYFRRRDESACSRGTTLLGGAAGPDAPTAPSLGSRCRFYSPARPRVRGLSSGGSGVIFTPRTPPGFHRPRVAHGCVRRYSSHPRLSLRPVYGPAAGAGRPVSGRGGRPRRRRGPGGRPADPNGLLRARPGAVAHRYARPEYLAVSWAQRMADLSARGGGRVGQAARPVAAGPEPIYRFRHDSRTRSQM